MTNNQNLKIILYNINRILNPVKRSKVLNKLKKEKVHIALLQETYLSTTEHGEAGILNILFTYLPYNSGYRRGVATLIPQRLSFEHTSETEDSKGRYVLISGKIEGTEVLLLNVYIPPGSNIAIYRKIFDFMSDAKGILTCGGDWNNESIQGWTPQTFIQTAILKKKSRFSCRNLG